MAMRFASMAVLLFAAASAAASAGPQGGDPAEQRSEDRLESEYTRLLAMVRERKAPARQASGSIEVAGLPALGTLDAPVTVVEFGTLQCAFCRRHAFKTLPALLDYVDRGEVRYVYHDYPVAQEHRALAEAMLCAAEQDGYFEFRRSLQAQGNSFDPAQWRQSASIAGLDLVAFEECVAAGTKRDAVHAMLQTGRELGIRGTPTFLIGTSEAAGEPVRVERRIDGAQPSGLFLSEIDALLGAR